MVRNKKKNKIRTVNNPSINLKFLIQIFILISVRANLSSIWPTQIQQNNGQLGHFHETI